MVEIVSDSVKVFSESIMPAIQAEIVEELEDDTLLLKVEGFVTGEDQKYVANIIESAFSTQGDSVRSIANIVDRGVTGCQKIAPLST